MDSATGRLQFAAMQHCFNIDEKQVDVYAANRLYKGHQFPRSMLYFFLCSVHIISTQCSSIILHPGIPGISLEREMKTCYGVLCLHPSAPRMGEMLCDFLVPSCSLTQGANYVLCNGFAYQNNLIMSISLCEAHCGFFESETQRQKHVFDSRQKAHHTETLKQSQQQL